MTPEWLFFDVGSTLVDESAAYDHRLKDMLAGTGLRFEEVDQMRTQFAAQGIDGNAEVIRFFGLKKRLGLPEMRCHLRTQKIPCGI